MFIRNTFYKDFVFTPRYAVYNLGAKVNNVEDINLIINYALLSIYKATIIHITNRRVTENIIKRHLLLYLKLRIEGEMNKINHLA